MKYSKFFLLPLALCCGFSDAHAQQREDNMKNTKLSLKLNNMRNKQGQICVSLFTTETGFPSDGTRASFSKCLNAHDLSEASELIIGDVPTGDYALALFHDENSDSQLNTGGFGIPLEGFGFSNNPKIRFGAPNFTDCVVRLGEGQTILNVDLVYFR